jgi:hypothetical protein
METKLPMPLYPRFMKTMVPGLKCPRCAYVWVPRGRKGAKRCPNCQLIVEDK